MTDDDNEREIIQRLQNQVAAERKHAIEVHWTDPGPYLLPRCTAQQGGIVADPHTFELQLETAKGQRILIPLDASLLGTLGAFLTSMDSILKKQS